MIATRLPIDGYVGHEVVNEVEALRGDRYRLRTSKTRASRSSAREEFLGSEVKMQSCGEGLAVETDGTDEFPDVVEKTSRSSAPIPLVRRSEDATDVTGTRRRQET